MFRTLEISEPAELHVTQGQLKIYREGQETLSVPLEDLATITCIGSGIRLSTLAMAEIAKQDISLMVID